jgi:hypothetical protein
MEGHRDGYSARLGDDGLNAKDNFEFARVVTYRKQREEQRG